MQACVGVRRTMERRGVGMTVCWRRERAAGGGRREFGGGERWRGFGEQGLALGELCRRGDEFGGVSDRASSATKVLAADADTDALCMDAVVCSLDELNTADERTADETRLQAMYGGRPPGNGHGSCVDPRPVRTRGH